MYQYDPSLPPHSYEAATPEAVATTPAPGAPQVCNPTVTPPPVWEDPAVAGAFLAFIQAMAATEWAVELRRLGEEDFDIRVYNPASLTPSWAWIDIRERPGMSAIRHDIANAEGDRR